MGALTGNTVQSTYLDLVQLGKSGAGLPSHDGKEAALYDGAGYQIIGRTAVRHWLDPDPDAISGSYEFSTMGDKTQAQLEAAGWTFQNCTGVVSKGLFVLTATDTSVVRAYVTVSLAGDFYFTYSRIVPKVQTYMPDYAYGGIIVGETATDTCYQGAIASLSASLRGHAWPGGTWSTNSGGTSNANAVNKTRPVGILIRTSGLLRHAYTNADDFCRNGTIDTGATTGAANNASATTSVTFTKLALFMGEQNSGISVGDQMGFPFLRRYL